MVDKKSQTVSRSFRIKSQWLDTLISEAEREGISPNALLNKILEDFSLFNRHFARYGGMTVTKQTFSALLDNYPKEDLKKLAKNSSLVIFKDLFVTLGLSFNYENLIFFLSVILGKYANWFKYERHLRGNKEILHLRHNLGNGGSFLLGELIAELFGYLNINPEIETLKDTVTVTLSKQ